MTKNDKRFDFAKLWLDYIYSGMYTRGILDDKTRVLCVVGELFVMSSPRLNCRCKTKVLT